MVVIRLTYCELVMPPKDALALAEIIQRAEKYEKKYNRSNDSANGGYTFHVWPNEEEFGMSLISDDAYRMAKLAGKPEKN